MQRSNFPFSHLGLDAEKFGEISATGLVEFWVGGVTSDTISDHSSLVLDPCHPTTPRQRSLTRRRCRHTYRYIRTGDAIGGKEEEVHNHDGYHGLLFDI